MRGESWQMAWKESNGDKDPWTPRGQRPGPGSGGEGPPDLDEILRGIQRSLNRLLGGGSRDGGSRGDDLRKMGRHTWVLPLVLLCGWLIYDMFYFVDEQEQGVVLRFGSHVATLNAGLNMRLPRPLEKLYKVNVALVQSVTHQASMLTQDENIVKVEVAVQYRIYGPEEYLFHVVQPEATLRQATESAVRSVIGKSKLDFVLTEGRSQIEARQQVLIQSILDDYKSGLLVVGVEMQPAEPPEKVKAAFDDAIKAREDKQRLVNQAEAYQNDLLPRARGAAARITEEADGYRQRVISQAEGETSRFDQVLQEYRLAPAVMRKRLYLDAIESVLSNSSKVFLDTASESNQLIYLPVDRLIGQRPGTVDTSRDRSPGRSSGDGRGPSGQTDPTAGFSRANARDRAPR